MTDTDDVSVPDRLATERTKFANERTLLAYERTALAFGAAGVALIHVFGAAADHAVGWVLAAILPPIGIYRFLHVASRLRHERD